MIICVVNSISYVVNSVSLPIRLLIQFIHSVPWLAIEHHTEIPVDYSGTTYNIPWAQLIHKHVRTTDCVEVGYLERIGNEFVMVREDVSKVDIYHVSRTKGIHTRQRRQPGLERCTKSSHQVKFEREIEPTIEELRDCQRRPALRREQQDSMTVETKVGVEETRTKTV